MQFSITEPPPPYLLSLHDALPISTTDEFWLVADGGVRPFDGDLADYQAWLLARESGEAATIAAPVKGEHSAAARDRKSTRLNSSHVAISYAVFCLKKKTYIILVIY